MHSTRHHTISDTDRISFNNWLCSTQLFTHSYLHCEFAWFICKCSYMIGSTLMIRAWCVVYDSVHSVCLVVGIAEQSEWKGFIKHHCQATGKRMLLVWWSVMVVVTFDKAVLHRAISALDAPMCYPYTYLGMLPSNASCTRNRPSTITHCRRVLAVSISTCHPPAGGDMRLLS